MRGYSTHKQREMDDTVDKYRSPWEIGTLRSHFKDEECWAISPWIDTMWGTALGAWFQNGEYFDGEGWKKIKDYYAANPDASLRRHLEQLRSKQWSRK